MTDEAMRHGGPFLGGSGTKARSGSNVGSGGGLGGGMGGIGGGAAGGGTGHILPVSSMDDLDGSGRGGGSVVADLLEVPLGDLSLLMSPPVGGYGTRLHNLKIDLKEV